MSQQLYRPFNLSNDLHSKQNTWKKNKNLTSEHIWKIKEIVYPQSFKQICDLKGIQDLTFPFAITYIKTYEEKKRPLLKLLKF